MVPEIPETNNNEVAHAEKALEKSIRNEDLLRLMKLEKSMVYFNTSIRGNEVMLTKLQSIFQEPDYMDNELVEDVETELKTGAPHGQYL